MGRDSIRESGTETWGTCTHEKNFQSGWVPKGDLSELGEEARSVLRMRHDGSGHV